MTSKKLLSILLIVMMVFTFAACGGGDEGGEADTIVIGYIGPMTGDSQIWGDVEAKAIEMMVEKYNEEGGILGKQIELKIYDNRSDSVETTNAARKAIQNDKVVCIFGTDSSASSIAMDEVCAEYGIPHVSIYGTNYKVTQNEEDGSVRPYSFRTCMADPQLGDVMAGYAYDVLGYRKVAVLYEISSEYSLGITQNFASVFEGKGGKITIQEAYNTGDVDFRAQLTKIKDFGDYDALLIPATYKEAGLSAVQARAMGIDAPLLGVDSWAVGDIFEIAQNELKGSTFPIGLDLTDEKLGEFRDWFIERWDGQNPDDAGNDAYYAADAMCLFKHAIEAEGEATPEAITRGMENAVDVQGVSCVFSMDPKTHNPLRNATILEVGDKEFIKIDDYTINY